MDVIRLNNLYDRYGVLLTEKQQSYFEDYYFSDLSLKEISENNNVSRNAVHKQLKEVALKLEEYEEKLKLYSKYLKIVSYIDKIEDKKLKEKIKEMI